VIADGRPEEVTEYYHSMWAAETSATH
jgi:hypothetical protein